VLAQARQGGEILSTADLELAIDLLTGPAFYRRFIVHRVFPTITPPGSSTTCSRSSNTPRRTNTIDRLEDQAVGGGRMAAALRAFKDGH
jgi:hypothetical protein